MIRSICFNPVIDRVYYIDDITKCWGVSVKTVNGDRGRYLERFDFIIE